MRLQRLRNDVSCKFALCGPLFPPGYRPGPVVVVGRELGNTTFLARSSARLRIGHFSIRVIESHSPSQRARKPMHCRRGTRLSFPAMRFVHMAFSSPRSAWLRHQVSLLSHPRPVRHYRLLTSPRRDELLRAGLFAPAPGRQSVCAFGHVQLRRVALQVVAAGC